MGVERASECGSDILAVWNDTMIRPLFLVAELGRMLEKSIRIRLATTFEKR